MISSKDKFTSLGGARKPQSQHPRQPSRNAPGMLKSKSKNHQEMSFIKSMINNIYRGKEGTNLPTVSKFNGIKRKIEKLPSKGFQKVVARGSSVSVHRSGSPSLKVSKGPPVQTIPRERKADEEQRSSKPEDKKGQEVTVVKEEATQASKNVILLLDEKSKDGTMLGQKKKGLDVTAKKVKDLRKGKMAKTHSEEAEKKLTAKPRPETQKKAAQESRPVEQKYASSLANLERKLGSTNYYREKMKKLNFQWDEVRHDIQKYSSPERQVRRLGEYLEQHGIARDRRPSGVDRLRLNRLKFIIQKITQRPSRSYEQFSIFESYLILKLFVLPQNQPQTPFDTEAVVQILSDYLGREKQSIHAHKEVLENNPKFVNLVDFVEHLLFGELGEDAQDFKFGRTSDLTQIFEKEAIGVVRFSFLVDVFLLHFYILYNVTCFIDKLDMVLKIINALSSGSEFEIPQKYKMKTKWVKRVYYRTTKSKRKFIMDYDFMIFNEQKYVDVIRHFEQVIVAKGWKDGLILSSLDPLSEQGDPAPELRKPKPETPDSPQSGEPLDAEGSLRKRVKEKPGISQSRAPRAKRTKIGDATFEEAAPMDIDISSSRHNYFLSKRELELEMSTATEPPLKRVRETRPADPPVRAESPEKKPAAPTLPVKTEKGAFDAGDIRFYEFGIDFLKSRFEFEAIEVEELTPADKRLLAELVNDHIGFGDGHLKEVLKLLMKQVSTNVKEHVRNTEITLRTLKKLDLMNLNSKFSVSISHVLFKIEKAIEFLRKHCFVVPTGE